MLYAIASLLILGLANAKATIVEETASTHSLFNAWMAEHGKVYATEEQEQQAFRTFEATHAKITAHNAREGVSWTMGHNQFSDLTSEQFKFYTGFVSTANATKLPEHVVDPNVVLPAEFDIEVSSCKTKVKNQAQCGSCWAFSAIGAIEGQVCSSQTAPGCAGRLVLSPLRPHCTASLCVQLCADTLSEQELVDCGPGNGCNGGSMEQAFSWIKSNGITSEANYPYKARNQACNTAAKNKPVAKVSGYSRVSSESGLKSAVGGRPISIAVDATCLQSYRSGVIDDSSCYRRLDHGVLLTGYGTSSGKQYWKVHERARQQQLLQAKPQQPAA